MNWLSKISPEWSLRLALGLTYLYSGTDLIRHPTAWHWALPYWMKQIIISVVSLNNYLRIQGAVEIILALVLIAWFLKPKIVFWVALISTLEFLVILVLALAPWSEVNFFFTFRDIGLSGGSFALFLLLRENPSLNPQP